MTQRLIHLGLIVSSLICYLEWGGSNSGFLFQMEYAVFLTNKDAVSSFTHPLVSLPLIGQLLIAFTVFQKNPNKKLAMIGQVLMSLLIVMVLIAGLLSMNLRIIASTLPYAAVSVLFYRTFKRKTQPA